MDWKVEAIGPQPTLPPEGFQLADIAPRAAGAALKGRRLAWFPEKAGYADCPVYDRYLLAPGDQIAGPALIEDKESTCVIGVGESARVDAAFNLIAEVAASDPSADAATRLNAVAAGVNVS